MIIIRMAAWRRRSHRNILYYKYKNVWIDNTENVETEMVLFVCAYTVSRMSKARVYEWYYRVTAFICADLCFNFLFKDVAKCK